MKPWIKWMLVLDTLLVTGFLVLWLSPVGEERPAIALQGNASHGEELLYTAGCYACHTNVEDRGALAFAGGPELATEFGSFYAPNITSSTVAGIGDWTITEFEAALRQGRSPEGHSYYPAFPFLSYRSLTDQDVADLYAAMLATEPVDVAGPENDVGFPFNIRLTLKPWRWMFATTTSLNIDQSTLVGRGRYLVDVVGHCGECHNPRNSVGAFIPPYMGGSDALPGNASAPPIHTRALQNLDWTEDDLFYFLSDGMMPDGDYVGGSMVEVIDHATSRMSDEDRTAIAQYLFSLN